MNPGYLWLTDAIQLLTFFVVGPVLAAAIAFSAWRGKLQNAMPERFRVLCVASGATAFLLFAFAKWINADVRTPWYFLQVACVLSAASALEFLWGAASLYFYTHGAGIKQRA